MKNTTLAVSTLLLCSAWAAHSISVKDEVSSLGKKAKSFLNKKSSSVIDELSALGKKANEGIGIIKKAFTPPSKPTFCASRAVSYAPTIDDPEVIAQDVEDMIPVIKKYSPILYLCNELYYPIAVEDLFTAPGTQLVYYPPFDDEGKTINEDKIIVVPKGHVTMENIYEHRTNYSGNKYFFEIDQCTRAGANPANFSDQQGNLTTPVYVTWSRHNDKIYIVYVFIYGFNGAYPVSMPVKGDHDFDVEHITLELNENKELERIFFAAHTSREGSWLPAEHESIEYEGTHPIVYVAQTGHGSYPEGGTYVRIYGFGNDITCKTKKWIPQLVLVYPEEDVRFNPQTMGWAAHSGDFGRGVGSFKRFFNGANDLPKGQPYDKVLFCPNPADPTSKLDLIEYQLCIEGKRLKAKIP